MKKKTKVLIPVLSVIVLLLGSLQLSNPIHNSKKANDGYSDVLSSSVTNMDARVVDIAVLGAHDAFTNKIARNSAPDTNDGGITCSKAINIFAGGLARRLSKAQTADAATMLKAGVRYFDVRITKYDDVFYTMHGYLSATLDYYVQDVVDFLAENPGEYVIFDIQHYYTCDHENFGCTYEEYKELYDYIDSIKNKDNRSLFDYANYDTKTDTIGSLTYGKVTKNKSEAGTVILAKTEDFDNIYYRDGDASFNESRTYHNVRSYWHDMNSTKEMLTDMEYEYNFIKEHDYDDLLRINQAQKTGLQSNITILKSLCMYSIVDMAVDFNAVLVKDKDTFIKYLGEMPVLMVDEATSNKNGFNKKANEYMMEFNRSL